MDDNPQTNVAPTPQPAVPQPVTQQKKSKNKLFIMAAVAVVVIGGGLVAAQSVMNSPSKVWERALSNTSKGIETFINLSESQQSKGMKVDGSFAVAAPLVSDGSVSGHFYDGSGSVTMDFGASGFRIDGEVRAVSVDNSDTPDVYFKVDGLESVAALLGFAFDSSSSEFGLPSDSSNQLNALESALTELNDQWYVVDHTLIGEIANTGTSTADTTEFSEEDALAIVRKVTEVMDEYIFKADSEKAMIDVLEENGKEDFEGTSTRKYKAGVNKENFKAMIEALRNALRDTKFADLMTEGTDQTYDEITDLTDFFSEIDEADFSKATADVWVEANGKYVRNIRIYPVEDSKNSNYLDIGIPFGGGDVVPLLIRATVDDSGSNGVVSFGADINSKNADSKFWFDANMTVDEQPIEARGELSVVNTDEMVDVSKPDGAKNVIELVSLFGLDSFTVPSTTSPDEFDSLFDPANPIDDIEL